MKLTSVLTLALIFGAAANAADPQLMNLVMPDAKVLAGVNVVSAKNSPLGQFLITRVTASGSDGLNSLRTATGFDPLQDVTEILAASVATPGTPGGLILMDGNFDSAKIVSALPAGSYTVSTRAGATLVTFTPKEAKAKVTGAVAFIGSTIAVAGDVASVTAALDRSSASNSIDPALAVQVNALSGTEDAWFVSTVSPASIMPAKVPDQAAQAAQFLASVKSFSGGVKFGQSVPVTLDIVADTPQNAEALANVAKFLVSMLGTQPNAPTQLLQTLVVKTSGSTVDLALTIPEAQIEALIGSTSKPGPRKAKAN